MRRWAVVSSLSLATACSYVGVELPPASIDLDTRLICTDFYWLPAADGAAVAAVLGLTAWSIQQAREGCEQGDARCDGQSGLLLLDAIPFVASAVHGIRHVRRCRDAKAWQRATARPPIAGTIGTPCIPVFEASGRCERGVCDSGQCSATSRAETRRRCAGPIAIWRAEPDPARREAVFAAMPAACQALLGDPAVDRP
jgi:hypothetical protein